VKAASAAPLSGTGLENLSGQSPVRIVARGPAKGAPFLVQSFRRAWGVLPSKQHRGFCCWLGFLVQSPSFLEDPLLFISISILPLLSLRWHPGGSWFPFLGPHGLTLKARPSKGVVFPSKGGLFAKCCSPRLMASLAGRDIPSARGAAQRMVSVFGGGFPVGPLVFPLS